MSAQRTPITQDGLKKLIEELDQLKKVERPLILKAVKEARSHGDLSENAEYDAAREKQAHIESRISFLEDQIAGSEIISFDTAGATTIIFGHRVKIMDVEDGFEEEYLLVGANEADPASGKISTASPIGKALLGKQRGDQVSVETPGGTLRLKVVDFS